MNKKDNWNEKSMWWSWWCELPCFDTYWLIDEMLYRINVDLNSVNYSLFHVMWYCLCEFIVVNRDKTCDSYDTEVITNKCLWYRGHCPQVFMMLRSLSTIVYDIELIADKCLWYRGHWRQVFMMLRSLPASVYDTEVISCNCLWCGG